MRMSVGVYITDAWRIFEKKANPELVHCKRFYLYDPTEALTFMEQSREVDHVVFHEEEDEATISLEGFTVRRHMQLGTFPVSKEDEARIVAYLKSQNWVEIPWGSK